MLKIITVIQKLEWGCEKGTENCEWQILLLYICIVYNNYNKVLKKLIYVYCVMWLTKSK